MQPSRTLKSVLSCHNARETKGDAKERVATREQSPRVRAASFRLWGDPVTSFNISTCPFLFFSILSGWHLIYFDILSRLRHGASGLTAAAGSNNSFQNPRYLSTWEGRALITALRSLCAPLGVAFPKQGSRISEPIIATSRDDPRWHLYLLCYGLAASRCYHTRPRQLYRCLRLRTATEMMLPYHRSRPATLPSNAMPFPFSTPSTRPCASGVRR